MERFIVFIMTPFKSHMFPSFKMATILKELGIQSIYISSLKMKHEIESRGFIFYNNLNFNENGSCMSTSEVAKDVIKKYSPQLFLVETSFWKWALQLKGLKQPFKMIQTWICCERARMLKPLDYRLVTDDSLSSHVQNEDDWVRYNNKQTEDFEHSDFQLYYKQVLKEANLQEDVIHISKVNRVGYFKVKDVEEIILFPKEFDVERDNYSGINYIGPFIYENREQNSIDWLKLNIQNRPIVYCAMGSLTNTFKNKNIFFKKIISAFAELKDYFLILVSGPNNHELLANDFGENIYICEFAPQIDILKQSSLFITHGGAGSIKESIKFGVPMLVYPWKTKSDMYGNADRLEFHKIGQLGDIDLDSIQTIKHRIIDVHTDKTIRLNLSKMQNIFLKYEKNEKQYLEKIIACI